MAFELRFSVDYRSNTLGKWPGLEARFPNEVKSISFQRGSAVRVKIKQDLQQLLKQKLSGRQFTGRMMRALDARIGPAGGPAALFPWISWGYFVEGVSGGDREDDHVRALRNYVSQREHGWTRGDIEKPGELISSRLGFYLVATGRGVQSDGWWMAKNIRNKQFQGAEVLKTYQHSSVYESRVKTATRGLARDAFRMAMGRSPTGGEFQGLG